MFRGFGACLRGYIWVLKDSNIRMSLPERDWLELITTRSWSLINDYKVVYIFFWLLLSGSATLNWFTSIVCNLFFFTLTLAFASIYTSTTQVWIQTLSCPDPVPNWHYSKTQFYSVLWQMTTNFFSDTVVTSTLSVLGHPTDWPSLVAFADSSGLGWIQGQGCRPNASREGSTVTEEKHYNLAFRVIKESQVTLRL